MKRTIALIFALAAAAPVFAAEETLQDAYGVISHVSRPGEDKLMPKNFEIVNRLGIRFVRTDFDWWRVENPQGQWHFGHLDTMYAEAGKRHIEILPILTGGVKWWNFSELEKWQEYIGKLVTRYRTKSPYWEVWNEPNQPFRWKPKAAEYAALLKSAHETIKSIDPQLKVLYGGTDGVPLKYIEETFRHGAKDAFDIMNVHPYNKGGVPEENLAERLAALRRLMKKYGIDRDIWITEFGDTTASNSGLYREPLAAAFREIGIDPAVTELAVLGLADSPGLDTAERFPKFKSLHRIEPDELKKLDPKRYPILLPAKGEAFDMNHFNELRDYVRKGGTVIFPAGLPLYYNIVPADYGLTRYEGTGWKYSSALHIGWQTFWTAKGTPTKILSTEAAAPFKAVIANPVHVPTSRFLTDQFLKGNDKFIPLLYGINGEFRGVTAALYRLDSDLKGNLIVFTSLGAGQSITERRQAEVLPRYFIIAFSQGVKKVFWYSLRSWENTPGNPEAHYGILHRNHTPKPAYDAFRLLTGMLPDGSTVPVLKQEGRVYTASWKRPDGAKVFAVWTAMDELPYQFPAPSAPFKRVSLSGKETTVSPEKGMIRITASAQITYFISR